MTSTNTNINIKEIDMTILNHPTQQPPQSPKGIIKNSYIMMHTATATATATATTTATATNLSNDFCEDDFFAMN